MKPSANARKVAAQRSAQRLSDVQRGISLLRDRRLAKGHVQEVLQKLVVNRFVSRFQMGLEQLQKEDRKEEEEEEEDLYDLPETPHTRRETLVGASCISPPLSNTTSVGITDSGLPWNAIQGSRRLCNCLLLLAFAPSKSAMAETETETAGAAAPVEDQDSSPQYVDTQNGFRLSPPPDWAQSSKSGAAIIFKDSTYKFNNLGVTVTPVRVASLEEFASVEDAANKLISFEKSKESTKEATLNHLSTRVADNLLYYDFDYTLETTRGNKRVVSTVCINKNKLYIANGQYFCGEACSEENADKLLLIRNSLQSFAVY